MNRIDQIKIFLQESPDDNFLIHALALEYIKIGDEAAAKKCFEQNLLHTAGYVPTYYHLGKLLERSGDVNAATDIYKKGMDEAKAAGDMHAYGELRSAYENLVF